MKLPRFSISMLFVWILLNSCNTTVLTTSEEENQSETPSAALTAEAILTQFSSQDPSPTVTFTNLPTIMVVTDEALTATQSPSAATSPTYQYPTSIPCDTAGFVEDVTIPDGTEIEAGAAFTKIWRLRNDGTCSWSPDYKVVFSSGDAMGGPASQEFTSEAISPGETVDVSIELTAPTEAGSYVGYWMLENASGEGFGLGAPNYPFFVEINVVEVEITMTPTATTTPTGITEATATATPTPTYIPTDTIEATTTLTPTQVETTPAPSNTATETTTPTETP